MKRSNDSIATIITVTIPIVSAFAAFLSLLLNVQQSYAQLLTLSYIAGILVATVFRNNKLNRIRFDRKFLYFVISLLVAAAIPLLLYIVFLKPDITITKPLDHTEVLEGKIIVSGTADNLPNNNHIWLITYHKGFKKYYPQREVSVKDNKWYGEVILPHGNTEYEVWAVITNPDESEWYAEQKGFITWKHPPMYFYKVRLTRPPVK